MIEIFDPANIMGAGFNSGPLDGEPENFERSLRVLAEIGYDAVGLGVTNVDIITGGHIVEGRDEGLFNLA